MGFFNWLVASNFEKTEDGRYLFRTSLRHAYRVPTGEEYARLRRQLKIIYGAGLIAVGIAGGTFMGAGLVLALALWAIVHLVWTVRLSRRLEPVEAPTTLTEFFVRQARRASGWELWIFEGLALAFVVSCIVFFETDPLLATVVILFAGLCAAVFAAMLVIRHRGRV